MCIDDRRGGGDVSSTKLSIQLAGSMSHQLDISWLFDWRKSEGHTILIFDPNDTRSNPAIDRSEDERCDENGYSQRPL